ncbi:UNKNOWN [Stylonychia lemnae]|uniref:VWFA domain-containing protein n=1 Tax=Stylonychia lemnae TaxID=5949 RepID=A0A077ZXD6_STYLE|nr:UNKNOWN [Stylonychia lemnae]|eukprot:CDW74221.1 UNKNOWN [Stylonychia lemnae]
MVFVFLVDRSGSMKGNKMDMTLEALRLFIKSLPTNARFEIISFGSKYSCISKDGQGFIHTDLNIKKVKKEIAQMTANLGGTNIHDPLEHAIKRLFIKINPSLLESLIKKERDAMINSPIEPKGLEKIRKIFLLTDGAVNNPNAQVSCQRTGKSWQRFIFFC